MCFLASPAVRDLKNSCDSLGVSIEKFLMYETLTQDKMPCYSYDEMLNIFEDAHKGRVKFSISSSYFLAKLIHF